MTNKEKWENFDFHQKWKYVQVSKEYIKELKNCVEKLKDLDNFDLVNNEEVSRIMIDNLDFCEKKVIEDNENCLERRKHWKEKMDSLSNEEKEEIEQKRTDSSCLAHIRGAFERFDTFTKERVLNNLQDFSKVEENVEYYFKLGEGENFSEGKVYQLFQMMSPKTREYIIEEQKKELN